MIGGLHTKHGGLTQWSNTHTHARTHAHTHTNPALYILEAVEDCSVQLSGEEVGASPGSSVAPDEGSGIEVASAGTRVVVAPLQLSHKTSTA